MTIRVHPLDTGRVMIHRRQVEPARRLRLLATLLDRRWTPWLSVWSFAIEHPDGLVVVDAGQDPDHKRAWWDLYEAVAVRFDATPADALDVRLREAGLDPAAVSHHVFTHLHVDHVGAGPIARPVLHRDEWKAATRPGAQLLGYRRARFSDPLLVGDDHDLFGDGRVRLLATPGHTAGHQSVLVTPDEGPRVLLAGDAVYSEDALVAGRIDGVAMAAGRARASVARLQALCREAPTVVAPTHDTGAAARVTAAQAATVL
ncbi:MAG TPA: N-acyl homoserine lactonase family protein [Solirubrobacteraceae bacterium]